ATYTSRAAEKLRRQHSAAKVISVFIVKREDEYSSDFSYGDSLSNYTTLPAATSITQELIKPALELVDEIYRPGHEYKKAGVMLSGLVPEDSVQGNLFITDTPNENKKLMDML